MDVEVTNDKSVTADETIILELSNGPSATPTALTREVRLTRGYDADDAVMTAVFPNDLEPGGYMLTARSAAGLATIAYGGSGQAVTILPLVTISSTQSDDTVAITATVTEGPIGDAGVQLTINLRGASSTPIRTDTVTFARGASDPLTVTFTDVPSGDISVAVSAVTDNTVRISSSSARFTVLPKVELTLASRDNATATATARITDGTISSTNAVALTAHIVELGGATANTAIRGLSSASVGGMETATFTGLAPGNWALDSRRITTSEILLTIGTDSVTILPLVTITSTVNGDDVTITATVTEGPIGSTAVPLTINLLDTSGDPVVTQQIVTLVGGFNDALEATFNEVPSGDITIGASADMDMDKVRITNPGATITILPKVALTLVPSSGTATATAEITDGTLSSARAVTITAIINGGPSSATQEMDLPALSGNTGTMATFDFTGLEPGEWMLDSSIPTPAGILLTIDTVPTTVPGAPVTLGAPATHLYGTGTVVVVGTNAPPYADALVEVVATHSDGTVVSAPVTLTPTDYSGLEVPMDLKHGETHIECNHHEHCSRCECCQR